MYSNYLLELDLQRLKREELERKMARGRHQQRASRSYWQRLQLTQRFRNQQQRNRRLKLGRSTA